MDKFKNLLSLENWGSVFDAWINRDPELGYCHFLEIYLNLFNKSFPVIEILWYKNIFQKWITPALVKSRAVKS